MRCRADLPALSRDIDIAEARRVLNICNVCGFCNGLCPVFPAAEDHPGLDDDTVVWLSHLCHACRSCRPACQYAPPHPFAVDIPLALSRVREGSWTRRPWLALTIALAVPLLVLALVPAGELFAVHEGPGAFYRVMPLPVLVGTAFAALAWPLWRLGRDLACCLAMIDAPITVGVLRDTVAAIATLRGLDGGGPGCTEDGRGFPRMRRISHLLVMHGFLLDFLATGTATIAHHVFGWAAPYALLSPPVILGTVGGIAIVAGSFGLIVAKARSDPALDAAGRDFTLPSLLAAVAATGLALLMLRATAAMGLLLAIHMGLVLALFATFADSRLAHAPWRAAALLRAIAERRARQGGQD